MDKELLEYMNQVCVLLQACNFEEKVNQCNKMINGMFKNLIDDMKNIKEYLQKRIDDVEKAYNDLIKPYYIEGVGINTSYMSKKEKEEFINKRNCLLVQKQTYQEILNKIEGKNNE